jgi:hypothetical protein
VRHAAGALEDGSVDHKQARRDPEDRPPPGGADEEGTKMACESPGELQRASFQGHRVVPILNGKPTGRCRSPLNGLTRSWVNRPTCVSRGPERWTEPKNHGSIAGGVALAYVARIAFTQLRGEEVTLASIGRARIGPGWGKQGA